VSRVREEFIATLSLCGRAIVQCWARLPDISDHSHFQMERLASAVSHDFKERRKRVQMARNRVLLTVQCWPVLRRPEVRV